MSNLPAIRESLLHRFVDDSIDYEGTGAPIPRPLLLYAGGGGVGMVLAAFSIQAFWPSPHAILNDDFYLIAAKNLAGFVGVLKALATPMALIGLLALAATAYLAYRPRQKLVWHYACVGELVFGVGSLGASALVLVAIVLTAIVWLILICLGVAVLVAVLGGIVNG